MPQRDAMSLEGWIQWVTAWACTPYGVLALFILAAAESSFFPIPPDVLLIALGILQPEYALCYAGLCTVGSVVGGFFGYLIGVKGGRPLVRRLVSDRWLRTVETYYQKYDVWAVGIAGFTPLPYKVFTISAGMFMLDLKRFIFVSVISRGTRFFLVGALIFVLGDTVQYYLTKYLDMFSVLFVVVLVLGFLAVRWGARKAVGVDTGETTDVKVPEEPRIVRSQHTESHEQPSDE
jgi:membrane protein YqaA with SNARE-associated domain